MFGMRSTYTDSTRKVEKETEKAQFRNFYHAAASISKTAKASVERAEGPSDPGTPVHTHRRTYFRRAIRYAANKMGAVIGPVASIVGGSARPHEFGEIYKGVKYPERPTMRPALEKSTQRFAGQWKGSIGS